MQKVAIILAVLAVAAFAGTAMAAHSDHGCSNCHVPHKAGDANDPTVHSVPLWSNAQTSDGLPTFDLYSSSLFDELGTDIGQPDGASKLCLGCHDGSYAVFTDYLPDSSAIFDATSLANSHPISFTYDSALAGNALTKGLRDPAVAMSGLGGTIEHDLLDTLGKLQCSSCHDVHTSGIGTYLLRYDAEEEDQVLCRVCHDK